MLRCQTCVRSLVPAPLSIQTLGTSWCPEHCTGTCQFYKTLSVDWTSCASSVKKGKTLIRKNYSFELTEGILEVFLFSRYHFHNWNVSRKCGFRNITTYLSLNYFFTLQFDTVTRVKASNTHQNAGFHPARPSSSESTESMSGKCKSVSWGVCTENKICDTILKQCRTNVQVPLSFNCNEIISGEPKTDF